MMRLALIAGAALTLAACAEGGAEGGVANYDSLKKATQACEAKGGVLRLPRDAAPEDINNYVCEKK